MRSRDEIYLDIISAGLLAIRTAGWSNNAQICAIEADHLHNIPSLIGQNNELLHQFYFDVERPLYIDRISEENAASDPASSPAKRYREYWNELAELNPRSKDNP
jgi:hypothetical protein